MDGLNTTPGTFSLASGEPQIGAPEPCPDVINGVQIPATSPLRVLWARAYAPDDPTWTPEQRLVAQRLQIEAAKVLAGFVHPKLAQIEHRGSIAVTHEEALKALE